MSKGLGKGISALMDDEEENLARGGVDAIAIELLQPGKYQPRRVFAEEELMELSDSIRTNGVMQPILVRALDDEKYEIIAGERRWRASKLAGFDSIPAIVRELTDKEALEFALIENIQRQDLNPLEEADGYQKLIEEFEYTQEELARVVGKSRSHITNLLRLLKLPDDVKKMLEAGALSMGHARAILTANDPASLAEEVVEKGLSVRQTERLASGKTSVPKTGQNVGAKNGAGGNGYRAPKNHEKDEDIIALEETLSQNIGMKVEIFDQGQQGQVVISYGNLSELDDALRRLGGV